MTSKVIAIGQNNGDIQIKTIGPNNDITTTVENAHGCDSKYNCKINYIQQLPAGKYNSLVVTSGDDNLVKYWDVDPVNSDLKLNLSLSGHTDWVYKTIQLLESGRVTNRIASASKDGTIRIWSIIGKGKKFIYAIKVGVPVHALENYPGSAKDLFASGDSLGRILLWSYDTVNGGSATNVIYAQLPSAVNDLRRMAFENQYLGAATSNNCMGPCSTMKVGNFSDQGSLWIFNYSQKGFYYTNSTTFSLKYLYFVYGDTSLPDSLKLDLPSGSPDAHTNSVNVIEQIQEISGMVATASSDGNSKVWYNKNFFQSYGCHTDGIYSALGHVAQSSMGIKSTWLIDGSQDTNVNTYLIKVKTMANPLKGVSSTGQKISALRIINM